MARNDRDLLNVVVGNLPTHPFDLADCGNAMTPPDKGPPRFRLCICWRNHALQKAIPMSCDPLKTCAMCPHESDCRKVGSCLDDVNAQYLTMSHAQFPRLMTPAQATKCMNALKSKTTLRRIFGRTKENAIIVTSGKFRNHCNAYPEWGSEANRLAKANEQAAHIFKATVILKFARQRSAESRRTSATCANGHVRTLENTFYVRNERDCLVRRCKDCNNDAKRKRLPTEEQVRGVITALHHGETLSSSTPGYLQPTLRNFIRKNPKIGNRLRRLSKKNAVVHMREARRSKRQLAASPLTRGNGEDAYEAVRCATSYVPADERDDVMSLMFVAIAEGRLRLSDASSRVGEFVRAHRCRPRVLGDARYSLDNPLGDGSTMTWLDTKTEADRLWA